MVARFTAFKKIRERSKPKERSVYDSTLFPVHIPPTLEDVPLAQLVIPSLLVGKFEQHSILRLGQLNGMTAEQFLSWEGFGSTCLKALCHLLESAKNGSVSKNQSAQYEELSKVRLAPDVLSFRFDKLNVSTLLRSRLKQQLHIETVAQFIDAFESGKFSRPYFGTKTLEHIWQQIAMLTKTGTEQYLKQISLDSRTFLELVHIIREQLEPRERLIFDHRFCPIEVDFVTLEVLAQQLDLTRERVRQIEKALIKGFQSGTLREFGWLIRRRTLELFQPSINQMGFQDLLHEKFFSGVLQRNSATPAPFVFLDRVFYSTFIVNKNAVTLSEQISRQRNFT